MADFYEIQDEAIDMDAIPQCFEDADCGRAGKYTFSDHTLELFRLMGIKLLSADEIQAHPELWESEQRGLEDAVDFWVSRLSAREAEVFLYLIGIKDGYLHDLDECAELFSVSEDRVAQIFVKAIRSCKRCSREFLRSFFFDDSMAGEPDS